MWIIQIISALLLTLLIELVVARLLKFRGSDETKVIVLMNVITNPALNVIASIGLLFFSMKLPYIILFLEVIVVFVEFQILNYVFIKDYSRNRLLLVAITLNVASYSIGLLLTHFAVFS